jgi:hypothetical protein
MAWHRWPVWNTVLPALAWTVLLALLPWWLGLPLLFTLVAALLLLQHRLAVEHASLCRQGLRWGLPGVLFALQRALGGDAFAWGAALLGALVGYTLLAGLEAWLDRDQRRTCSSAAAGWPELAMAPIGPAAEIIELQPVFWQTAADEFADPRGGSVSFLDSSYRFADGSRINAVGTDVGFSPAGRWLAFRTAHDHRLVLWDRERNQQHHLRGWQLCGWYREQPWLIWRNDDMPMVLPAVLGRDDEG